MFCWDYDMIDDSTVLLHVGRDDKGIMYRITKQCDDIKSALFWLKHFQTIKLDDYKLCACIVGDLENRIES